MSNKQAYNYYNKFRVKLSRNDWMKRGKLIKKKKKTKQKKTGKLEKGTVTGIII